MEVDEAHGQTEARHQESVVDTTQEDEHIHPHQAAVDTEEQDNNKILPQQALDGGNVIQVQMALTFSCNEGARMQHSIRQYCYLLGIPHTHFLLVSFCVQGPVGILLNRVQCVDHPQLCRGDPTVCCNGCHCVSFLQCSTFGGKGEILMMSVVHIWV